jgi:hypothetical protein
MKDKLTALVLARTLGNPGAGFVGAAKAAEEPADKEKADKPLEQQLIGYWAPDWDEISVYWKPMFKELAKLGGPNLSKEELAEAEKEAAEEAKEYCRLLTIEFTKDQFRQHSGPGSVGEQAYVVKKVDAKTGTIEVELVSGGGGKPERDSIVLKGDRLTMTEKGKKGEGQSTPWILDRIDKETFEKRQKAAAESQKSRDAGEKPQDSDKPAGK